MESTGRFTRALTKLVHYTHSRCSICGSFFPLSTVAYAGYASNGQEIYVGECCKRNLVELASHIYWYWTQYQRPTFTTPIWRYMDFGRYCAMLKDAALYFARADTFEDRFEGASGLASRKQEWEEYCIDYFKNAIRTAPSGMPQVRPTDEYVNNEARRLFQDFQATGEKERLSTFVSCWHNNTGESEAQWRLYAPPPVTGLALRTTFGRLDEALDPNFEILGGFVQYADFRTNFAGTYDRLFWKRASLSHEAEVRLVIKRTSGSDVPLPPGLNVGLNIDAAFDSVVISPYAPVWFEDVVKKTTSQFGYKLSVERSGLIDEPFY